jgi:hypothetical protein
MCITIISTTSTAIYYVLTYCYYRQYIIIANCPCCLLAIKNNYNIDINIVYFAILNIERCGSGYIYIIELRVSYWWPLPTLLLLATTITIPTCCFSPLPPLPGPWYLVSDLVSDLVAVPPLAPPGWLAGWCWLPWWLVSCLLVAPAGYWWLLLLTPTGTGWLRLCCIPFLYHYNYIIIIHYRL